MACGGQGQATPLCAPPRPPRTHTGRGWGDPAQARAPPQPPYILPDRGRFPPPPLLFKQARHRRQPGPTRRAGHRPGQCLGPAPPHPPFLALPYKWPRPAPFLSFLAFLDQQHNGTPRMFLFHIDGLLFLFCQQTETSVHGAVATQVWGKKLADPPGSLAIALLNRVGADSPRAPASRASLARNVGIR